MVVIHNVHYIFVIKTPFSNCYIIRYEKEIGIDMILLNLMETNDFLGLKYM